MKNTQSQSQAIGARRLRRFSVRVVLDVREVQAEGTLKRPEGRAPALSHDSTSEFGFNALLIAANGTDNRVGSVRPAIPSHSCGV